MGEKKDAALCQTCGAPLKAANKFCKKCGAKVEVIEKPALAEVESAAVSVEAADIPKPKGKSRRVLVVGLMVLGVLIGVGAITGWYLLRSHGSELTKPIYTKNLGTVMLRKGVTLNRRLELRDAKLGYEYAMVLTLTNKNKKAEKNMAIVENIPKLFAENVSRIDFVNKPYKVLNKDPAVMWKLSSVKSGKETTFRYSAWIPPKDAGKVRFKMVASEYGTLMENEKKFLARARTMKNPEEAIMQVVVSPGSVSVNIGAATLFAAKGITVGGKEKPLTITDWKSSNPAVAAVNAQGVLVAQALGTVTVTASMDDLSGFAVATVVQAGGISTSPQTVMNSAPSAPGQSGSPGASPGGGSAPAPPSPPAPTYAFSQVGISNQSSLGAYSGNPNYDGVPFILGCEYTQGSTGQTTYPTVISRTLSIPKPQTAYILLTAGYGYTQFSGRQIGTIDFSFTDGSTRSTALVLGYNIREWWITNSGVVTTTSSSDIHGVSTYAAPGGGTGTIDMLTINIQSASTLTSMSVRDISASTCGSGDPIIKLHGITVQYQSN
ncbi:MAG: zinc ribbon domain-containing protein [Actinomycetota bacterium]